MSFSGQITCYITGYSLCSTTRKSSYKECYFHYYLAFINFSISAVLSPNRGSPLTIWQNQADCPVVFISIMTGFAFSSSVMSQDKIPRWGILPCLSFTNSTTLLKYPPQLHNYRTLYEYQDAH